MSSSSTSEEIHGSMIPNHLIVKILDFPLLLSMSKAIKENASKSIFFEKEILHYEKISDRIISEIEQDFKILHELCHGTVILNDLEKKDMIKRHAKYPWNDCISYCIEQKSIDHLNIAEKQFINWDINTKRFMIAVSLDNINIVSYYISKDLVYEDPEVTKKCHIYIENKDCEPHPILNTAFEIAITIGSVKMMTFLWNVTPTPYQDFEIASTIVMGADNIDARMFLAQLIVDNEWEYAEEERNVLQLRECLDIDEPTDLYNFIFEKEDDVEVCLSDYKKIIMISLEHRHFDIFYNLIEELEIKSIM
jgi:hypothetical protein